MCEKSRNICFYFFFQTPSKVISSFLSAHSLPLALHNVAVPSLPPLTKAQYTEWSNYWPLVYRKDNREPLLLSVARQRVMLSHLTTAVEIALQSRNAEDVLLPSSSLLPPPFPSCSPPSSSSSFSSCCVDAVNGCLIIPPGQPATAAKSDVGRHPLRHAVMVAVELVAAEARTNATGGRRQKFVGGTDEQAMSAAATSSSYYCTGADVFVAVEPCVMCSMALLHSRVATVTYCVPNGRYGGLWVGVEGRLNHQFKVFRANVVTATVDGDKCLRNDL
eukprot:GHVS01103179.1.p1 GENE.GHVS01103179.1~~GHVS01103179.1.p1  ORF type:complete len:276 (+),score=62.77 GHVS01103179.1:322-1149(+)